MIRFIFKRLFYGLLVIFGVVTVVFLLFNVLPGDPARMRMGQRSDDKSLEIIRKDLNLDLPLLRQYMLFINDLSVVSFHNVEKTNSRVYLDSAKYGYTIPLFS
ncbi:MAG TPA: ABC transporter permease, partial [Bacteroidia bacterium]|nr:ABC transporter permease [Bacteroidia bacterium]